VACLSQKLPDIVLQAISQLRAEDPLVANGIEIRNC
jgi:hypothetical protein